MAWTGLARVRAKRVYTNEDAFAVLMENGTVTCVGPHASGGQGSSPDLERVQGIRSTSRAFAALKYKE